MKKITVSTLAVVAALATSVPVTAQETATRLEGESAMEMAARLGLCGGSSITSARFVDAGATLEARCAAGAAVDNAGAGGLGTGGTIAAGLGIAAVIGVVAASSSSSGTN